MIEQHTHLLQIERTENARLRQELRQCKKVTEEMRREIAHITRRYLDLRAEVQRK